MPKSLPKESLQQLFTEARTHHAWLSQPISDDVLRTVYDLCKWGPTSVNCCPMRIIFVKSVAQKEKLYPCLMGSNVEQCKAAPVTALIGYDMKFYDKLPILFPAFDAKSLFTGNPAAAESTAFRNGSLEGAYFMMAARSLGLDVCPMSGFDNNKLDEVFLAAQLGNLISSAMWVTAIHRNCIHAAHAWILTRPAKSSKSVPRVFAKMHAPFSFYS